MPSQIESRNMSLPAGLRQTLVEARRQLGWSQAELGKRVGLPQMHISGIETGRVVPRYDTLVELVRALGYELVLIRREAVPMVQSLTRNRGRDTQEEQPLYAPDEEEGSS